METESGEYSVPSFMRAIEFTGYSKEPKRMTMVMKNVEVPQIGDDELLIKVRAFGLNFGDVMIRKGLFVKQYPVIPGYEVSGIVVQRGRNVQDINIGDKVMALCMTGGYAEYAKAKKEATMKLPEGWNFSQGAAALTTFTTAYLSLLETGPLREGTRVLVHSAAGGLGCAAIQLARLYKCEIYATCGSDQKVQFLKDQMGVQNVINYNTKDFETEINRLTYNQGVDIILDPIGGYNLRKDMNVLRVQGRVIGLNAMSMMDRSWRPFNLLFSVIPHSLSMVSISTLTLLSQSKGFFGVNLKAVVDNRPDILQRVMRDLYDRFRKGELKPLLKKEMDWNNISDAFELLENRKAVGKIVMTIPESPQSTP